MVTSNDHHICQIHKYAVTLDEAEGKILTALLYNNFWEKAGLESNASGNSFLHIPFPFTILLIWKIASLNTMYSPWGLVTSYAANKSY